MLPLIKSIIYPTNNILIDALFILFSLNVKGIHYKSINILTLLYTKKCKNGWIYQLRLFWWTNWVENCFMKNIVTWCPWLQLIFYCSRKNISTLTSQILETSFSLQFTKRLTANSKWQMTFTTCISKFQIQPKLNTSFAIRDLQVLSFQINSPSPDPV